MKTSAPVIFILNPFFRMGAFDEARQFYLIVIHMVYQEKTQVSGHAVRETRCLGGANTAIS